MQFHCFSDPFAWTALARVSAVEHWSSTRYSNLAICFGAWIVGDATNPMSQVYERGVCGGIRERVNEIFVWAATRFA